MGRRTVKSYYFFFPIVLLLYYGKVEIGTKEKTLARFIIGLHKEIADSVEFFPYATCSDMISLAVKIERQRKKGRSFISGVSKSYGSSSSSSFVYKEVPKPDACKEEYSYGEVENSNKANKLEKLLDLYKLKVCTM